MKMAKASEADIAMAIEIANMVDSLTSPWCPCMPEKLSRSGSDDTLERFDIDDTEQCRRVLDHLIGLCRSASLFRVVMGMAVLLDPVNEMVDPDADTLEHHPDRLADRRRFDWFFSHQPDHAFVRTYMEGMQAGWTPDQWRAAIDRHMDDQATRGAGNG